MPNANPGSPSVTRFIHNSCIAVSGDTFHMSSAANTDSTSPMLHVSR